MRGLKPPQPLPLRGPCNCKYHWMGAECESNLSSRKIQTIQYNGYDGRGVRIQFVFTSGNYKHHWMGADCKSNLYSRVIITDNTIQLDGRRVRIHFVFTSSNFKHHWMGAECESNLYSRVIITDNTIGWVRSANPICIHEQ